MYAEGDVVIAIPSVCLFVYPSNAGIVSKPMDIVTLSDSLVDASFWFF